MELVSDFTGVKNMEQGRLAYHNKLDKWKQSSKQWASDQDQNSLHGSIAYSNYFE